MIPVAVLAAALAAAGPQAAVTLPVPIVVQAPERCGPAALAMVLRYYGAADTAVAAAERAYDPVLRGALITDLARAARRAGFDAEVETPSDDSLRTLLAAHVPPIVLYLRGIGPIVRWHYAVVVGWEPQRDAWLVHDGTATPRRFGAAWAKRWRAGGGQALIVRPRTP